MAQYVYQTQPARSDTTIGKVATITSGVGSLITAIDRALHPGRYAVQSQPGNAAANTQQPKESGFGGVAKWLLIAGLSGGAIYVGKELLESKKED